MVMIGDTGSRFVTYPIRKADPNTGKAIINWIAMLNFGEDASWRKEDWNRRANIDDFLPRFAGLKFDWIDVQSLIGNSDEVFEYPKVDRDPIDRWTEGRVSLMGDAAHAAYPVGSNGAGSAIIDARKLGAAFIAHGLSSAALEKYEEEMRPTNSKVVLANRSKGPDAILDTIDERCGGEFKSIDDVMSREELAEHAHNYKLLAGYAVEQTNNSPPIIEAT